MTSTERTTKCDRCDMDNYCSIFPDGYMNTDYVYLCGECVNELERRNEDEWNRAAYEVIHGV